MITSEFMQDVKSQLTFSLIRIKHDLPLMQWDGINGKLIYHGNTSKTLIPMHKTDYDRHIKFEKYCK
jgi:hypothetical protein